MEEKGKIVTKLNETFDNSYTPSIENSTSINFFGDASKYAGLMVGIYSISHNPNGWVILGGAALYILGSTFKNISENISDAKRFTLLEKRLMRI